MSMASYEPDWDAGTENAWEQIAARASSSMCAYCRSEQAAPDDDLCPDCLAEVMGEVELERMELP